MDSFMYFTKKALVLLSILLSISCESPSTDNLIANDPSNDAKITFPLENWDIWQEYGVINEWAGGRYHCAEDLIDSAGTPVYAAADGQISWSGPMSGYGWLITIDHDDPRVYTLYGHISTRRWKIEEGRVKQGDLIGYLGDGDEISDVVSWMQPHLHFGIRYGSRYTYPTDASDARWMAGYTHLHPSTYRWYDPTDYINSFTNEK